MRDKLKPIVKRIEPIVKRIEKGSERYGKVTETVFKDILSAKLKTSRIPVSFKDMRYQMIKQRKRLFSGRV